MEEDIDTKEFKMPNQVQDDLVADLAGVKLQQKNMGYRERLYSSSGVIIEGLDPSLKDKIALEKKQKQLAEE